MSARVLIIETNLIWSVRLAKGLEALGYTAKVYKGLPDEVFDVAIVNLGEPNVDWPARIKTLHERGTKIIAHAGHKEKDLHALGRDAGCDVLVTNGELTHKLGDIVARTLSA